VTNAYRWVQWNRHKRVYDGVLAGVLAAYIAGFVGIGLAAVPADRAVSPPVLLIRAFGTAAAILLHVILAIGPLARISPSFTPILYNRRHLGVTCFVLALLHAVMAIGFYGGFGDTNPLLAVLAGPGVRPPFEIYGFGALAVLFVMAATSHDFWLANLGHRVWKWMHMGVYAAYVLLIAHIAFGALASERSPVYAVMIGAGVVGLSGLHILAGFRERARDRRGIEPAEWLDLGPCDDIPESRARVVCVRDRERVAVFRDGDQLHAVTNVCAHQGGPLGEGKIVDGCITCPWHGYQYRPADGCSPPPYTEKIATYELRLEGGRVLLNPEPNPPGTPAASVQIPREASDG
jgi:sulfoxide reductase heme-binding subunit YedZ